MSWFIFTLICVFGWGTADIFYKKSSNPGDRYSHLKIAVWVGLVMGIISFILLVLQLNGVLESGANPDGGTITFKNLAINALKYSPASLSYIISMVIGYAGMRYLEASIISPVQNASGAFSMLAMLFYFIFTGSVQNIMDEFSVLDLVGTALIVIGLVAIAIAEQRLERAEEEMKSENAGGKSTDGKGNKYRFGALALLFPILYCVFDTIGTAADGIILDGEAGLSLNEIDVLVLYGFTFLLAGIAAFVILWIKEKKPYNMFCLRSEWPKLAAAASEEFGQIFYVYAMAKRPMLAAPMIASYCIVTVIFSRIFLKEKFHKNQYICICTIILGIVLLGISEGISA